MERWAFLVVLQCAVGAMGCAADPEGEPPFPELVAAPSFPGEPQDPAAFDDLLAAEASPTCRVAGATNIGVSTELRIFYGSGTAREELGAFLGGLQQYYAQYGVAFVVRHEPIELPFQFAIAFDRSALTERVRKETGFDLNDGASAMPSAELRAAVLLSLGRGILHNVRELLRVYAVPRRHGMFNVVLLPRMLDEPTPELAALETLAGLGISPEVIAGVDADDPSAELYEWLDVRNDDFTPTAIVGIEPTRRYLATPDVLVAHEVGHAYGLDHVWLTANLMHPNEFACDATLAHDQLARVAGNEAQAIGEEPSAYAIRAPALTLCTSATDMARSIAALVREGVVHD